MKHKFIYTPLLLLLMFFSGVQSYAQDTKNAFDLWLASYNQGIGFYNTENYSDAVPHFEDALKFIDQIDFSTTKETELYPIENKYYLGICYLNINISDKALPLLEGALADINQLDTIDQDYVTGLMTDLGHAYASIDLEKSYYYRKTVVDRLKTTGVEDITYGINLYNLAITSNYLGKQEDFYDYLIDVERILSALNEIDNDYYAFTAFYLGNFYFKSDDYKNANRFFSTAEELKDYLKDLEYYNYIEVVYLNGVSLYRSDLYELSLKKLNSIVDHSYLKQKENIDLYAQVIDTKAMALHRLQKFEQAKKIYEENLLYISNTLGNSNGTYGTQNANYGQFLIDIDDFSNAEKYLTLAYELYQSLGLKKSNRYVLLLNSMGQLNFYKGNYKTSETFYLEALELQETLSVDIHINQINIINNLALIYQNTGDYDKADNIYQKILIQKKEILGETHSDYAITLMNYGNFLHESGNYFEAEKTYNTALNIFKNTIGTSDTMYARQLLNLGQFYITTRQNKKSLSVFNEAISIYTNNNSTSSYAMGLALAGKGLCFQQLGEIDNALKTQLEGLEILKQQVGESQIDYGKITKNVGLSYFINGNAEKALEYYNKAFEIYKKSLNDGHYLYGVLLHNIGETLMRLDDIPNAIKNIDKALANFKTNFGENSYYYSSASITKGIVVLRSGNYEEAQKIFEELEPTLSAIVDSGSDLYNILVFHLALTYDLNGNKAKATEYYIKNNDSFKKQLKDVFTYRSESEKKQFLNQYEVTTSWLSNSVFNTKYQNTDLITIGFNNHLLLKGLLLNSTKDLLSELSNNGDEKIKTKIETYRLLRKQREKLLNSKSNKSDEFLSDLKSKINSLETDLVKLYNESPQININSIEKDWNAIKSSLKDNEIALEFTVYRMREGSKITNNNSYGVYIIHKNWKSPKVIELFKESDLNAILKDQSPNTLYNTRGSKAKSITNTKGLYELIWSPLEEYLEGIETVYFSPSGLLNQIPFAALDTKDQPILASQYNLVQLSSTYALAEDRIQPKQDKTLFIGGIDYEYTTTASHTDTEVKVSKLSALKSVSGTRSLGTKWNYLPGTLKEVNSIESLFSKNNKTHSTLSANKATETNFKNLGRNSPNIIHIATHGYFFENPKTIATNAVSTSNSNVYKVSEDPLLRSGLIFSGANYAWQNGNNPYEDDDGILTALEISNLDLSNTDMVILSACETGLGDIDGSEGVYGLQRAFKMAGVDLIMMSLWEVPDVETSEFMTLFYTNWLSGQDVRTAFRNTQLVMSTKYKDNPEKWAAFVLFE